MRSTRERELFRFVYRVFVCRPRWSFDVRVCLPFLNSTAAAPTALLCSEPSEYTFISSLALSSVRLEASLSAGITTRKGVLCRCAGLLRTTETVSNSSGGEVRCSAGWWSGERCLLTCLFAALFIGLWRRCSGGSAAMRIAALRMD
jgi:hypothetical protein